MTPNIERRVKARIMAVKGCKCRPLQIFGSRSTPVKKNSRYVGVELYQSQGSFEILCKHLIHLLVRSKYEIIYDGFRTSRIDCLSLRQNFSKMWIHLCEVESLSPSKK
jgi:hypothetical protein